MRLFRIVFTSLFLVLAWPGCGGGSSPTATALPAPPALTNFRVDSSGENLGRLRLTWDYPKDAFDGYVAQASIDGLPFQNLFDTPVDRSVISIELTWPNQDIPELVPFAFRLCTTRGTAQGAYVEAAYRRAIIPPVVHASTDGIDGVQLAFSSQSKVATTVEIQRSESDGTQQVGGLILLAPVAWKGPALFWVDPDVEQGKRYYYRCALKSGSETSATYSLHSQPVELLSVSSLTAEPGTQSVHLAWKNRNRSVVTQKLIRDGVDHRETDLLPGQQAFTDAVPLPGPYRYRIRTQDVATRAQRDSATVSTAVGNPPGAPLLDVSRLNTGLSSNFSPTSALRLANGTFAFAGRNFYGGQLHYYIPSGDAWIDFEPAGNPTPATDGFFVRSDGTLCAVFSIPNPEYPSTSTLLRAASFDGQSWKQETVGGPLSQPPGGSFQSVVKPDGSGDPVIGYMHLWSYSQASLMVLAKSNGQWVPGLGVGIPTPAGQRFGLGVDRDNVPWIWDGHNVPIGLHKILPMHQIESHSAPADAQRKTGESVPVLHVDRENRFHILFDAIKDVEPELVYLTYRDGAWSGLETVLPVASGSFPKVFLASKDGTRSCVLMSTGVGLVLADRRPTGAWELYNLAVPGRLIGAWLNPDASFSAVLVQLDGTYASSCHLVSERR